MAALADGGFDAVEVVLFEENGHLVKGEPLQVLSERHHRPEARIGSLYVASQRGARAHCHQFSSGHTLITLGGNVSDDAAACLKE